MTVILKCSIGIYFIAMKMLFSYQKKPYAEFFRELVDKARDRLLGASGNFSDLCFRGADSLSRQPRPERGHHEE